MRKLFILAGILFMQTVMYAQVVPISSITQNNANGVPLDTGMFKTVTGIVTVANQFGGPSYIQDNTGGLAIFYTDFSVDSTIISYYRYPKKLTLTDPNNPESQFDDSFEADFDEKSINKIISATVSGFDINNNSERWQLNNVFAKKNL